MATDLMSRPITMEEFLELERNAPDDVRLELIAGQVREYPGVTTRSPKHAEAMARISQHLLNWLDNQPADFGSVADGEARCRLIADPETILGLDVAYFEGEQHVHRPEGQSYFDGPPVLAVEVLSPSDTHENVHERIRLLLRAGVAVVWVADPDFRTLTVYRSESPPRLFSEEEELTGGSELPEFACRVGRLFGRS